MTQPPRLPSRPLLPPDELFPVLCSSIRDLPAMFAQTNIEAIAAWTIAGASLFPRGRLPKLNTLLAKARLVLLTQAYESCDGNITHIAHALGTSRRLTREYLQQAGLHPARSSNW